MSEWTEKLKFTVGKIVNMEYEGKIAAFGAVVVDKDGQVMSMVAVPEGHTLMLLAGASLLHHEVINLTTAAATRTSEMPGDGE